MIIKNGFVFSIFLSFPIEKNEVLFMVSYKVSKNGVVKTFSCKWTKKFIKESLCDEKFKNHEKLISVPFSGSN